MLIADGFGKVRAPWSAGTRGTLVEDWSAGTHPGSAKTAGEPNKASRLEIIRASIKTNNIDQRLEGFRASQITLLGENGSPAYDLFHGSHPGSAFL
jgi:hypothetical protein